MKRFKRREFLERSGKIAGGLVGGGILGSLPILNSGCKGGPGGGSRTPVTVNVSFYNHMQGPLGQKTYEGLSGSPLTIRISDLGYSGIDPNRMGTRKASGSRETMGEFIRATRNGVAGLTYPDQNESWEVYNLDNGPDYSIMDINTSPGYPGAASNPGILRYRNLRFFREDEETTGPDWVIEEAIRQLKEPLDHPWKKYGDLILEDEGIIRIGYSTLISVKPVSYSLVQVFVDPTVCDSEEEMLKYFIQGIFSFNCAKNKSGLPTFRTICNEVTGGLLDEAKAQWASAFVTN